MKNKADKQIIQEAIKATLNKEIISEGPLDAGVFDKPSRALGAVGNMFSNIGGQMKLGSINKQLDRTAKRIEGEWDKAEDVATKLATKMQSSRNPNIKQSGAQAMKNIQSASNDMKNATNKLRSMSSSGADKLMDQQSSGEDSDFETRTVTTKAGNKKIETPVERWAKTTGVDYNELGSTQKNHLNKLFMDLRNAGINPFKVSKDKQELLLNYSKYRNKQIQKTGSDPFPNYEHFEKVLGKKYADALRNKDFEDRDEDDEMVFYPPDPPESDQNFTDDPPESQSTPQDFGDFESFAEKYARENKFSPEMTKKWIEYIKGGLAGTAPNNEVQELEDDDLTPISKVPPPVPNAAKSQTQPIPLTNKKQSVPQQQSVKVSPIKSVGSEPSFEAPKQQTGEPIQTPKLTDFFGLDDQSKLPTPNENVPIANKENEVQVGDVQNPAFKPMPAKKKRTSTKSKKKI